MLMLCLFHALQSHQCYNTGPNNGSALFSSYYHWFGVRTIQKFGIFRIAIAYANSRIELPKKCRSFYSIAVQSNIVRASSMRLKFLTCIIKPEYERTDCLFASFGIHSTIEYFESVRRAHVTGVRLGLGTYIGRCPISSWKYNLIFVHRFFA